MQEEIAIKVDHVSKYYRIGTQKEGSLRDTLGTLFKKTSAKGEEFRALDDVSFEIKKGDVVGIIGKNGAGKSTLLKILSQITKPTKGRVEINGRIASLLEVGTGFHPDLTGRENIYLNGTILGMTRQEVRDKFDEIVAFSGVEKFIDTPVKNYSSGMYVRLAFAVAAHLEPEILIIDEVLAVGDAEFQKKCLGKMGEVAGEGRTVIFVSHDLAAISNLCTTSILLNNGEIVCFDKTKFVIKTYNEKREELNKIIYKASTENNRIFISEVKCSKEFNYNEKIVINFLIINEFDKEIENVNIILKIYDSNFLNVISLESRYLLNGLFNISKANEYYFEIENVLKSGKYTLELFILLDSKIINEIFIKDLFEIKQGHPYMFTSSDIFSGLIIPKAKFNYNG